MSYLPSCAIWVSKKISIYREDSLSPSVPAFANHRVVAGVAELVDAPDLGSGAARRGGSSPFTRTKSHLALRIDVENGIMTATSNINTSHATLGFQKS